MRTFHLKGTHRRSRAAPAAGRDPGRRPGRRRVGAWAAALTLLAGGGVAAIGEASSAQAFDCWGTSHCPFVKIESPEAKNPDHHKTTPWMRYEASAELVDAAGGTVHRWHERAPEFTLWHWRYYGGGGEVRIHVHAWSKDPGHEFSADNDFTTPADTSLCLRVDQAGAYQSGGCTDHEDPAN
jgi:hypothetical protein